MLKKFQKVIIATILIIVVLCDSNFTYAAAPEIKLPSDSAATITNFTVRRTVTVTYNCSQPIGTDISRNQVVGYCYTYIGSYRAKNKVDGKYFDGLLIKSNMVPSTFYNKNGQKKYGFSQYLQYSMTLNKHCTYQGNTPINDTSGSDEYSIGITGGSDGASVSGTVNCNSKYCDVTDLSNPTKNLFKIEYDYIPSASDWKSNSTRNKKVLFASTWQMATCTWTTSYSSYNVVLDVYAKFGTSSAKNGSGMTMPLYNYSSKATGIFINSFR
ncbi:MAG: hypothetical protein IJD58_06005 [Lachnospiraceae bacterium]|nr:hypothetical protein [Lachnospiraceae bacterium]